MGNVEAWAIAEVSVAGTLPTDFGFTGQRNDVTIDLYDYHARWYDLVLDRYWDCTLEFTNSVFAPSRTSVRDR